MMIEILLSAVLLIPFFLVLHKFMFRNLRKTAFYFVFSVYLAAVYLFVGMPTIQFMRVELSLTVIPFLPMLEDIRNTALNVLLFAPLGILLPFLWQKYRCPKKTVLFGALLSLIIELLQILTYRATDINDIIANTLGAALGFFVFKALIRAFPKAKGFAQEKNEVAVLIITVAVVMFFLQPYLASFYYSVTQKE